jgi:hypothetical protein
MKSMKSREFNIATDTLDFEYDTDVSIDLIGEYIEEDLQIPTEFIKSFHITDKYVNIKLSHSREYFNDDWYVNLQRVS